MFNAIFNFILDSMELLYDIAFALFDFVKWLVTNIGAILSDIMNGCGGAL